MSLESRNYEIRIRRRATCELAADRDALRTFDTIDIANRIAPLSERGEKRLRAEKVRRRTVGTKGRPA